MKTELELDGQHQGRLERENGLLIETSTEHLKVRKYADEEEERQIWSMKMSRSCRNFERKFGSHVLTSEVQLAPSSGTLSGWYRQNVQTERFNPRSVEM